MDHSDADAVAAVLQGHVERYAELVDRYQRQALQVAFSLLGNYDDAKDAAQEAFFRAYRALARFRGGAKFSTWLYRIVVNECKDVYKRRAREPRATLVVGEPSAADESSLFVDVEDPTAKPGEHVSNRELGQRLSAAIGALPGKQRTAFVLHHVHGLPLEDVAAIMQCRLGTVKSHIFRATDHLRSELSPWVAQEGVLT